MKMRTMAGVAVFVAIVFSWLWLFTLSTRLRIYFKRDKYRIETFEVTGTVDPISRKGFNPYWLTGTVAEHTERVCPELPPTFKPHRLEDLLSLFPRGSTIPVLYDPDTSEAIIQGESLRVLHFTPDFWVRENRLRNKLLCFVLLPTPLALAFYFHAGRRARDSSNRQTA